MGSPATRRTAGAVLGLLLAVLPAVPAAVALELPPLPPLPTLLPPLPLPTLLPLPGPSPTAKPSAVPTTSAPGAPGPAPAPPPGGDDYSPNCSGGVPVPPKLRRSPPRNTNALMAKAQPLLDLGLAQERVMAYLAPPFPVAGPAKFSDDWKNPRWTPCPHLHMGTDIFAPRGTPVVATGPGVLSAFGDHPVGGLSVWVTSDDLNSYFYTHLDRFAPGIVQGQRLRRGTVLGYVGSTGNAAGGSPHLHFQVHAPLRNRAGEVSTPGGVSARPGGLGSSRTPPVNPKPILDGWLEQAVQHADALVAEAIRRGGVLPSDEETAEIIRSQTAAFAEGDGFLGLGPNANRGILIVTGILGSAAMLYALGVVGRTKRMRPKPKPAPDLSRMSLYTARTTAPPPPPPEATLEHRRRRRGPPDLPELPSRRRRAGR